MTKLHATWKQINFTIIQQIILKSLLLLPCKYKLNTGQVKDISAICHTSRTYNCWPTHHGQLPAMLSLLRFLNEHRCSWLHMLLMRSCAYKDTRQINRPHEALFLAPCRLACQALFLWLLYWFLISVWLTVFLNLAQPLVYCLQIIWLLLVPDSEFAWSFCTSACS